MTSLGRQASSSWFHASVRALPWRFLTFRSLRVLLTCWLFLSSFQAWGDVDLTLGGLAPLPKDGAQAAHTIRQRQQAFVAQLACADEFAFLNNIQPTSTERSSPDTINMALAKMYWYAGLPDPYRQTVFAPMLTNCDWYKPFAADHPLFSDLQSMQRLQMTVSLAGQGLNVKFVQAFGPACSTEIPDITAVSGTELKVHFRVTAPCLRAQFNAALRRVQVTGQMGSSGPPCHIAGKLHDEETNWDFAMRSLIRILYFDYLFSDKRGKAQVEIELSPRLILLDGDVRQHIKEDLIITGPDLGPEGYPVTGCGNTERVTGDAATRVNGGNFFDDVTDALGDVLDWFLKHWYITYFPPAGVLTGADPLVKAVIEAAAGANVGIQTQQIAETENHRLMIESTRYLNNYLCALDLTAARDNDNLDKINSAQKEVRKWLLRRLQSILRDDFSEYNARPYQRESIGAIMNLYDFSPDPEMRIAAQLVLEYASAKYAIGSNQSRRLPPFRRHMSAIADPYLTNKREASILFPVSEADHQVALGLLYEGQTQQLDYNLVAHEVATEAAFGAFSWYAPNWLILDLAINKSVPYFQRFHHAGVEAYSSGKGFLLTAGGVKTTYTSSVLGIGDANDIGAAMPTTVIFPSGKNKTRIDSFLRFEGPWVRVKGVLNDAQYTYDQNACIARNFVCGANLAIPADMNNSACLQSGPPNHGPWWKFFDSKTCPGYAEGPPVYLAIYERPCNARDFACRDFGFIEAVDAPEPDSPQNFQRFKSGVLDRNSASFIPEPYQHMEGLVTHLSASGTYVTTDGRRIRFDIGQPFTNSKRTGLIAVGRDSASDWTDWPLADGDLVQKNDWPLVRIKNPRFPEFVISLDFRGLSSPRYEAPYVAISR